ncbi:MAG: hypothetical protein ACLQVM_28730 [Terriglobia bacterium]
MWPFGAVGGSPAWVYATIIAYHQLLSRHHAPRFPPPLAASAWERSPLPAAGKRRQAWNGREALGASDCGKHYKDYMKGTNLVLLDPAVAAEEERGAALCGSRRCSALPS